MITSLYSARHAGGRTWGNIFTGSECHRGGCDRAAHQLLSGIEAATNRYAGFFGLDCDCFAF